MNFYKKLAFSAIAGILLMTTFVACEDELNTIGSGVISGEPFSANKVAYNVYAYNKKIKAAQTNNLPIYQLGTFNDPVYGKTTAYVNTQIRLSGEGNPKFGIYSQEIENEAETDDNIATIVENETVKKVLLHIPYLIKTDAFRDADNDGVDDEFDTEPKDPNNDSDGDGLTNAQEKAAGTNPLSKDTDGNGIDDDKDTDTVANAYPKQYELDSIYGGKIGDEFNLKVERSTYFLRDLDPNSNFEERQVYYSNQEELYPPTSYVSDVLYDGSATISNIEKLIYKKDDDPKTEDKDESKEVETRLAPGIMVNLDAQFFQENLLDKEGEAELLSQTNFQDFIRGIYLSASGITEDIMFLLDFERASINIEYIYDKKNTNGTVDDITDDIIEEATATYSLGVNATTRNAVNILVNEDYPADITAKMDTGENADRIYLKGGAGSYVEIKLFDEGNGADIISQIKAKNWIINEAKLVFYVDRDALDAAGSKVEPPRLYLYNAEKNTPLYGFPITSRDVPNGPLSLKVLLGYGGIIEEAADGKGVKYTIRITEYINDLIVRGKENATLGLTITSDIRFVNSRATILEGAEEGKIPRLSVVNPMGTVLYGSNVSAGDEDKKLKLEIFYTETK